MDIKLVLFELRLITIYTYARTVCKLYNYH